MPLYDYNCREHGLFHELATMAQSGDPCLCPKCGTLSARVVVIPPQVLAMVAERRKAFEINEKAQHEPGLLSATGWVKPDKKSATVKNNCRCGTSHSLETRRPKGKLQQQLLYLPDGSKTFPSQRPWMISH
jgi:putative FmdB family regulatory protein